MPISSFPREDNHLIVHSRILTLTGTNPQCRIRKNIYSSIKFLDNLGQFDGK
jgi:hypothetical protein